MDNQQLQLLISQLQYGNDQQRRAASYKLGQSKNPEAVNALINALNDSDSSVRRNVIDGLRTIGTQEALDFLNSIQSADFTKNTDVIETEDITPDMKNALTQQQIQDFFAQEWRKRSFIVFLSEKDLAKREMTTDQKFKWFDWTIKNKDTQGAEAAIRLGLAYFTLGLSEVAILGARGAKFSAQRIGQSRHQNDVNISFLSERHLEIALALGVLREPEGSFALKTVYAGHPYLKSIYTSVAHFHELLFKEKAREIVRICSALGASRLRVTYARQQIKSSNGKASVGLPTEIPVSAKVNIQNDSSTSQEIWHEATYNPSHKPVLPPQGELIWYETEPQWKQLVEDRFERGLLTINLQIQSRQDYHVNRELAANIQSIGLSLGGEWIEHTQLLLTVEGEFVPLQNL